MPLHLHDGADDLIADMVHKADSNLHNAKQANNSVVVTRRSYYLLHFMTVLLVIHCAQAFWNLYNNHAMYRDAEHCIDHDKRTVAGPYAELYCRRHT